MLLSIGFIAFENYRAGKQSKGEIMTKTQIIKRAKFLGLCLEITSPGDGIRRYEFYSPGSKPHTYGRTLGYCRGAREAEVFLRGYDEGRESIAHGEGETNEM